MRQPGRYDHLFGQRPRWMNVAVALFLAGWVVSGAAVALAAASSGALLSAALPTSRR